MSPVDIGRIDAFEVLTKLTRRSVQFAYIVFLRREQGLPTAAADVTTHFKDCSYDLAAAALHDAADAGALKKDGEEWRVTPEGIAAMRIHFKGWGDEFDAEAEQRGMS